MSESSLETAVDRPAATAGLLAVVFAVVGTAPDWPGDSLVPLAAVASPLAFGLAVVAAVAFLARRRGVLERGPGSMLAGLAGAGIVVVSIYRLLEPAVGSDVAPALGFGLPITAIGGLLCLGFAAADYRGVSGGQLRTMGRYVALAVGLTVGSQLLLIVVSSFLALAIQAVQGDTLRLSLSIVLSPAAELVLVVLAFAIVVQTGRGWEFLDLEWPDAVDLGLMAVGVIGLLVVQFAVIALVVGLDLPSSSSSITDIGRQASELGRPEIVLLLAPMMILVVGPAEELLFRNVIQKYLYDVFSRRSAVLVASLVFALAHIPAYFDTNSAGLFISLTSIFVLSLVLGSLYVYSESIVVASVAHGVYNAILVVFLYVGLVFEEVANGAVVFVF